jgi:3-oxoacyl-[acyl-carrier protein] reductase
MMDLGLKGKIALVTASSEGLGFACAARLAEAGCTVTICARRLAKLDEVREALAQRGFTNVHALPADLCDAGSLERLVADVLKRFGRLDILVVNSGHSAYGGLDELSEQQWYEAFGLLLMSAVRLTRLVLPSMRRNKQGDIIFLGSSSVREPPPHLLLSTVMRLGVAGFAKTLSREVAQENIRVNLISPGYFDAGRVRDRVDGLAKEKAIPRSMAVSEVAGALPAGRIGSAEELAELVAFVASRRAGFLMGANIVIDGGSGRSPL